MAERFGSVRIRVTAAATLAVLVVFLATGFVVVRVHRSLLVENLDEQMELAADDLVDQVVAGVERPSVGGFGDDDAAFQVVDASGEVVAASDNIAGAPPLTAETSGVETRDDFRIHSATAGQSVVHLAATLDDVDESATALARTLSIVVPVVTALLGVGVWVLVGRALRPVEQIRAEVAAIGGAALHRRVAEPPGDDEVSRLARTMNEMLERVEGATERQRRFVADASHELRSPLTRMRAELEVDLAHPDDADPTATHRSVLDEAIGMQAIVEDLLHLARSDASAVPSKHAVHLDDVVLAEAPGAATEPAVVQGDPGALRRLVRNLVDNAERHASSTVEVQLHVDGDLARLTVADDGPGIPDAERERVFERFTRLDDARSAASGGTGLGLAIVRDIAEAHGGRAWIDPSHAPGTCVVVELPGGGR